jgi:hypothetical protein
MAIQLAGQRRRNRGSRLRAPPLQCGIAQGRTFHAKELHIVQTHGGEGHAQVRLQKVGLARTFTADETA